MEQHGNNPSQNIIAIIPARYSSIRLPGKLMLEIAGKPLILHTLAQTRKAACLHRIIVATDDMQIFAAVTGSGGEAMMTSADHLSGSDRVAEAAASFSPDTIIVNIQADEPLISPRTIEAAVEAIRGDASADIVTTCQQIHDHEDVLDPDVVKVVVDVNDYALYFSRAPIPYLRDEVLEYGSPEIALRERPELLSRFRKHTGLYAYRRSYLSRLTSIDRSELEKCEMLEQLRALQHGAKIKVVETADNAVGVDTQEDLDRVRMMMEAEQPA